jgi:hypothetical protein
MYRNMQQKLWNVGSTRYGIIAIGLQKELGFARS